MQTAALASGIHNLTVEFSGGQGYVSGSARASQTVNQAPLTVTAANATRVYGQANPAFTATLTGFVNGDSASVVTGAPSLGTSATITSSVGSYPITVAQGTLSAANYTFVFVPGTLTISQDATTTTGNPPSASVSFGQGLTVTATVTAQPPGSGMPTGSVDFYDTTTATDLGKATLASGVASLSIAGLPPGLTR